MLYKYKAFEQNGTERKGEIEAGSIDVALSNLQRKNLIVVTLDPVATSRRISNVLPFLDHVPLKDIVITSRQLAILFQAQISAAKAFELVSTNVTNPYLRSALESVTNDIQGGGGLAISMKKFPKIFSDFYVNMVSAGEESGKLTDVLTFLADYLERQQQLESKTKNALVYPAFVIVTFFGVIGLMVTVVIPKLGTIITDSGVEPPVYTKIVLAVSYFVREYWFLFLIFVVGFVIMFLYILNSKKYKYQIDELKIKLPVFGDLYRKLYLSRISENIYTMLMAGIPVVRTLEITAGIVGNEIYERILVRAIEGIKGGQMISASLEQHQEIPKLLSSMIRVGEETGQLASILKTLGEFYRQEVYRAVDTIIGLIEPAMIVGLGLMVGGLLTSILIPMYNLVSTFAG